MTVFAWIGAIVFGVGVVVMVVFDIILAGDRIVGNTFSQLARASVRHAYWLPFGLSALMGRWFHPVDDLQTVVGSVWFSYLGLCGIFSHCCVGAGKPQKISPCKHARVGSRTDRISHGSAFNTDWVLS